MSDFEARCTDQEVLGFFTKLSNWNRWGPDDQLGTLNFITPEKVQASVQLVQFGRSVSLSRDVATRAAPNNPRPSTHIMQHMGPNPTGSTDFLGIAWHGFAETHVDALCHEYFRGKIYNGYAVDDTIFFTGAKKCSIHMMRHGIVTRGVLLDIARAQGRPWLDVGERVHVEDLERAEALAKTRVDRGDAIIVRVGQEPRMKTEGVEAPYAKNFVRNGLDADCLPWLRDREVAVYLGDCIGRIPSGYPSVSLLLHQIGTVAMGLPLLENINPEEVADLCQELGRWAFMLTFTPLRLRGGTGSAVNPIAVF